MEASPSMCRPGSQELCPRQSGPMSASLYLSPQLYAISFGDYRCTNGVVNLNWIIKNTKPRSERLLNHLWPLELPSSVDVMALVDRGKQTSNFSARQMNRDEH